MPPADTSIHSHDWTLLILLSILWGGSFFFNGIIVREVPPFTAVFLRVCLAALLLVPLVKRLAPGLDGKALGAEMRERIGEELDYELEAQNQRRIERLMRGHPFISVPHVYTELSTRRVLVSDAAPIAVMRKVRWRSSRKTPTSSFI